MRFLDSDVMIDFLRDYLPAIIWLESLDEAPILPGYVIFELMAGCSSKKEMNWLVKRLGIFQIYWPSEADCHRALSTFARGRLTHNLRILDALIGECAGGMNAILCTFNQKHMQAIPNLVTESPYPKSFV